MQAGSYAGTLAEGASSDDDDWPIASMGGVGWTSTTIKSIARAGRIQGLGISWQHALSHISLYMGTPSSMIPTPAPKETSHHYFSWCNDTLSDIY